MEYRKRMADKQLFENLDAFGAVVMEGNFTVLTTKSRTLPMEDMTGKSGNTRMGMDCRDNTSLAC